ncbi:hypothetical protein ACOJBO_04610 [Rhizobium beringeri]
MSIPETGERSLLLGNFVQRLVGLSKSDSAKLYEVFQSLRYRPGKYRALALESRGCRDLG